MGWNRWYCWGGASRSCVDCSGLIMLAYDAAGNLAYLAPNRVNLQLTQERWPDLTFHTTREHAVKL